MKKSGSTRQQTVASNLANLNDTSTVEENELEFVEDVVEEVEEMEESGDGCAGGQSEGKTDFTPRTKEMPSSGVSMKWDFREAALPPGVEVVNGEAEFMLQSDGSSALFLPPMAYLKISFGAGQEPNHTTGLGGQLINDYTLSMDIFLESLPSESMSLFQCAGNDPARTEGETFVYPTGGVGLFGEIGVPEASLRPQKWHRVVVTMGPQEVTAAPPPPAPQSRRPGARRSRGFGEEEDDEEEEDEAEDDYLRFMQRAKAHPRDGMMGGMGGIGGIGGSSRSQPRGRAMQTYVDARKCATISADKRGVLAQADGRFAASTEGITVFGSNRLESMSGSKLVKFIEFRRGALTAGQVREQSFNNRVYSLWEKERLAELRARQQQLTLQPIYKHPPPMWVHPALVGQFGDAYLEGTGMEGGDLATSTAAYELVLGRLLKELADLSAEHKEFSATASSTAGSGSDISDLAAILGGFYFSHEETQSLNYLSAVFQSTSKLCKRFNLAKKNGAAQLVHYFKVLKKQLVALKDGESLLLPGGIGDLPVVYIVEREEQNSFRFCVVNTNPEGGLDWHSCSPETSPRLKYHTVVAVKDVTIAKMMDDAFWGILLKLAILPAKENRPDKLYNLLLPFLVDKPVDQIIAESERDQHTEFRLPQLSNTGATRCLTEASFYLMRRRGLSELRARQMLFGVDLQLMGCVQHDLGFVPSLDRNGETVIALVCAEVARTGALMGEAGELTGAQLKRLHAAVERLSAQMKSLPGSEADVSSQQPALTLWQEEGEGEGAARRKAAAKEDQLLYPLMERLRRSDDVNGLAGPPIVLPKYVPIDTLQIPVKVRCLADAVAAIRYCDRLCTLTSVQAHCIKNRALLKVSLIEHTFASVLPCPRAHTAVDFSSCVWQTPMSYSLQIDLAICLGRIMEHFISSAFSLFSTKSLDALKIILTGCIAAILDVTLRKSGTDQPSELCLRYMGERAGGRGKGFGISMSAFDTQSETMELHTPELSVCRAAVLDYFADQTGLTKIWNWSEGHQLDEPTAEFISSVCGDVAFPADAESLTKYMIIGNQLVNKNYPEFHILRDVAFYVKYVQNVDPRAFPRQKLEYSQGEAELKWDYQQGAFVVEAFARGFSLKCYPDPPFTDNTVRYPSAAVPSNLAAPHEIKSEDDVLHIKNLPSFGGGLGQQDSELLLSMLTVPYLRIPLVLSFFSTEDRVHALRSEELQAVLDSVLFEPARFLHAHVTGEPEEVPCRDQAHMATSHGLLLNELHRSPEVFLDCVVRLLGLCLDLDVGTFHSNTVPIILYVFRLASRVDSFVIFLLEHGRGGRAEGIDGVLRSIELDDDTLGTLEAGLHRMRHLLQVRLLPMLEAWCGELSRGCVGSAGGDDDAAVDANTRSACTLHAHMILLYRNLRAEDYTADSASTISSSLLFLTTRHTWNMNLLGIPEHEVFEMLATQRRRLITWTRAQPQQVINDLMEGTIRVTVGTGGRSKADLDPTLTESTSVWAFISGDRSVGRFSVAATRRLGTVRAAEEQSEVGVIGNDTELGIELDFQIIQLTMKSSHLQALDIKIAGDADVQAIFGKKSMQGSTVESTVHRTWVNLIGRGHSIQHWRTPDERSCVQDFDRQYSAGELEGGSEAWIVPIFEPVRMAYMTQPFVLEVCMPEQQLSPAADVACLIGIHPKNGGTWKEIYVFRALKMVHVYNVTSHGRRFYRVLEYTSNAKHTLREMQPGLDDRKAPWPEWERHGAGHPYADHWGNPISCVITRGWDFEQNLSGGEETYVPPRLLYGLLPQSLLDSHVFWQDELDNLRGYSRDASAVHFMHVELVDVAMVASTGVAGTCGQIRRLLKAPVVARLQKQMDLLSIIDKAQMVEEKDWQVDMSVLTHLGVIVDHACGNEELQEFIDGLKMSGVTYPDLGELLDEVGAFAAEQADDIMAMDDEETLAGQGAGGKRSMGLDAAEFVLVLGGPYASVGGKYFSTCLCLSRLDNAAHTLAWTGVEHKDAWGLDLIELPRLKMSFHEKQDEDGISRIFSLDHSHLFVSNHCSPLTQRLMQGLPHSLLLASSNDELQILVPAVDPVRPRIGSSPFSTELVMNRNDAEEWNKSLDTFYYLYPIHVSMSFLFAPTLSSGLYLLLARFLSRNYEEVFRLAGTIGTDTELSDEEKLTFQTLGRSNSDNHPDAHACRLKISHVTLDAPIACPWDLTRQVSRYITKLTHVSLVCRLSLQEERDLLQHCVCDSSDPRFFNAKGQPLYSLYEVTIVKNRKHFLKAMFAEPPQSVSVVFTVPRPRGSRWPVERNYTALGLEAEAFAGLEVQYAGPAQLSGHAYCDVLGAFWGEQEDCTGMYGKMGFLFIYELLTGTKTAKILSTDISHSLAVFLTELLQDKAQESLLPSILNIMCKYSYLTSLLPKYRDDRTFKTTAVKAAADDQNPVSPLGSLLGQVLNVFQEHISTIMGDHSTWDQMPAPVSVLCSVLSLQDMRWTLPVISDFSCSQRVLSELKPTGDNALALNSDELHHFATVPLSPVGLTQYTCQVSRLDAGLPEVNDQLPFNVSAHNQAQTAVAVSMLSRLKKDVKDFADTENSNLLSKCSFLADAYATLREPDLATLSVSTTAALSSRLATQRLIKDLTALRKRDEEYVRVALSWLTDAINDVSVCNPHQTRTGGGEIPQPGEGESRQLIFQLKRFCRLEASIWMEFLFASVLSSRQLQDLTTLNPFLTPARVDVITDVIVSAILHANRISHINRCIMDCRALEKTLVQIESLSGRSGSPDRAKRAQDLGSALALMDESLSRNLNTKRHYIDERPNAFEGGEEKRLRPGVDMTYDPRFLLFEFTWSILLRQSQVQIVQEYLQNLRSGVSTVKQMLMGAGKTTIVCPLLALMLGDGETLVVQVVPPALLELSRAVMRSTFSSIMHKRIFTLSFDRSTEANPTIYKKLSSSIQAKGVVITTPTTIKSMMLKFVEWIYILNDPTTPRSTQMETDCRELGRVLTLFREGVLVMDEVDLILHPMKSELNFPIGSRVELDYSPQRWQLPIHLLDAVFYAEQQRLSVGFKQSSRAREILEGMRGVIEQGYACRALQRNPHVVLLNTEWYHSTLRPVMTDWLYMWIETQHLSSISESSVKQYLMHGANRDDNPDLALLIDTQLSVEHKKMLNLGRDWLMSYLPHVLQKIDRVSFGLLNKGDYERAVKTDPHMPQTRAKLAIPFVGKDVPSKSSEFAHPDVIVGLTILSYRYEGLRWTDFEDIISNLRSTMTKETGPFRLRKSSLRYAGWVKDAGGSVKGENAFAFPEDPHDLAEHTAAAAYNGDKEVVPLRLLKRSNDEQMQKLFQLLKDHPDTIHHYLENFIFPAHMDSKVLKLSAAGQELGGEMLFRRRIGFSGTPSDLLPVELGKCGYEKGSDGKMIHVMTSPAVCSYEVVPVDWTPRSLLQRICQSMGKEHGEAGGDEHKDGEPAPTRFQALIDTGALITGMTNLEVAQSLLQHGLPWCEGVVFLDDYDCKMVLVRATGRVLKMAQCGIPPEQRFAFYDQVHTTGMDINHSLTAKAVLTLSKDMVFRDYAQGAFRMRGINKGQTIHLMLIPEVCDLIARELSKINVRSTITDDVPPSRSVPLQRVGDDSDGSVIGVRASGAHGHMLSSRHSRDHVQRVLVDINTWLVINSMRSERVQFNQLCIQNIANVWRKKAYQVLLAGHSQFTVESSPAPLSDEGRALEMFCEPIDFNLNATVPNPVPFADTLISKVNIQSHFVPDGVEDAVVKGVLDLVSMSFSRESAADVDMNNEDMSRQLGAEMVQEQEQEKEQQQEQEQEQEIEIEKYVDLAYSREHEEQTPWLFASLTAPVSMTASQPGQAQIPIGHPDQFYAASAFKLIKREPLQFPPHLLMSSNYFDLRWSGARRIKNVVMSLDYVPELAHLIPRVESLEPLSCAQEEALFTALTLFASESRGSGGERSAEGVCLTPAELVQVLQAAGHHADLTGPQMEMVLQQCGGGSPDSLIPLRVVRDVLVNGRFSQTQEGRRVVSVSLAEAETIRRIIHLKNGARCSPAASSNSWVVNGRNLGVALRCVSAGNIYFDKSHNFRGAEDPCESTVTTSGVDGAGGSAAATTYPYTALSAYESLRFLNCDMFFSSRSLNLLMRALPSTTRRARKQFFKNVLMCRRRLAKKWTSAPVSKLFTLADQFGMLKQRAQSVALSSAIKQQGMLLYDAFCKFDYGHNGYLTPGEVWGGFEYLGIKMTAADILDFVNAADNDNDGLLSFREFVEILQDPAKEEQAQERGGDGCGSGNGNGEEDVCFPPALARSSSQSSIMSTNSNNSDFDDPSMALLPSMQRQISLTPVLPKGEEELRVLMSALKAQEEDEEGEAESEEMAQERKIREELEREEDERDRLQEGGRNPAITEDMARFSFTTGRMPRRLQVQGDVSFSVDEVAGTFLKIHPRSSLLLLNPLAPNCGGRKMNQFTLTLEVQWHKPTGASGASHLVGSGGGGFIGGAAVMSGGDFDRTGGQEQTQAQDHGYWPLLTLGSGGAQSKAHLWADNQGRLFTCEAGSCALPTGSSASSSVALQHEKWHHVSVVVDCVSGDLEVFLDGTCLHIKDSSGPVEENRLHPPGVGMVDGPYSLGQDLLLFSDGRSRPLATTNPSTNSAAVGAGVRAVVLHGRCLHAAEVAEFTAALKLESQAGVVAQISQHLMLMGVDGQIAHWAATQSEGATVDQRINSALNIVYS